MRLTPRASCCEHAQRSLGVPTTALAARRQRERLAGDPFAASSDLGRHILSRCSTASGAPPELRITLHVSDSLHDMLRERVDIAGATVPARLALVARRLHFGRAPGRVADYIARCGAPQQPAATAQHTASRCTLSGRRSCMTFTATAKA